MGVDSAYQARSRERAPAVGREAGEPIQVSGVEFDDLLHIAPGKRVQVEDGHFMAFCPRLGGKGQQSAGNMQGITVKGTS
jgi:hypothetical protein